MGPNDVRATFEFQVLQLRNGWGKEIRLSEGNIFCISLSSTPNRWDRFSERAARAGGSCQRWAPSSPESLRDVFDRRCSPTEKACAQSHVALWRHLLRNQEANCFLIFEDDACFHMSFSTRLREASDVAAGDDKSELRKLPPAFIVTDSKPTRVSASVDRVVVSAMVTIRVSRVPFQVPV